MRKIFSGLLGIMLVTAVVGGTAYALFSDKVTIGGTVLGTATPGLFVSLDDEGDEGWGDSVNVGDTFANLLPGEYDWGELWIWNNSDGTTDKLDMDLRAKLTAAGGDWEALKNAVQLRVCVYSADADYHCDTTQATPFYTLADWNAAARQLLPTPLIQGAKQHYTVVFYIPSSYGNEIANKQITGMAFEVTGTQVP